MSDENVTPVMQTNQMKSLLPKDFWHKASYIAGLWLNEAGQMVMRFDDREGQNHYIGKSRVETALKKANIPFEQVEVKNVN